MPVASHVSGPVQAFPSLQAIPGVSVCAGPVVASQVSTVHGFPSSRLMAVPTHAPVLVHVSATVHALLSLQAEPVLIVCVQ